MSEVDSSASEHFRQSLPESYRQRHTDAEIAAHAAISAARGDQPARVGIASDADGELSLCIVAADAPSLLSHITAAIRLNGFDIVHAEAYTRRAEEGGREVLDLFRLQPHPARGNAPTTPSDIAASISTTLFDLLEGRLDPNDALPDSEPGDSPAAVDTRVRFIEDDDGALCTLEVETQDRSGLLLALAQALALHQVTILRSEVRTQYSRVFDRFTLAERDGSPISESRRLEIQVTVLSTIETPLRRRR
jgi:[protein-PII] uridylyltransferase